MEHCVGVGSGTDALRFALIAAGVQPGDSVLTVANTFIATTEAIIVRRRVPEFVEIDEQTYNIDPEKLREYLVVNVRSGSILRQTGVAPQPAAPLRHCAGSSLRADGRHGSDSQAGKDLQPDGD